MASVLLIHPYCETKDGYYYTIMPMGLISIGDMLQKDGHEVRILNVGLEKKHNRKFSIEEYIKKFSPHFVGIDMHWYPYMYNSIKLAKIAKENGCITILGGITASIFAKEILELFDFIDGVIIGEGEIPFSIAVNKWNNRKKSQTLLTEITEQ